MIRQIFRELSCSEQALYAVSSTDDALSIGFFSAIPCVSRDLDFETEIVS